MTVTERIDSIIQGRGLSRRQLALAAGIPPSSLQSAMARGKNMTLEMLQAIADALGVQVVDLLDWDAAKSRLYSAGLSVDDVANELAISVDRLCDVIERNDVGSTELKAKIIQVSTLLADSTERQTSTTLKRINTAVAQMTPEGRVKVADYAEDILPRYKAGTAPSDGGGATPAPQEGKNTTPTPDGSEGPQEGE